MKIVYRSPSYSPQPIDSDPDVTGWWDKEARKELGKRADEKVEMQITLVNTKEVMMFCTIMERALMNIEEDDEDDGSESLLDMVEDLMIAEDDRDPEDLG